MTPQPDSEDERADPYGDDGPLTVDGWKTEGDTDRGRLAGVVDRMESDVRAQIADETADADRSWLRQTEPAERRREE